MEGKRIDLSKCPRHLFTSNNETVFNPYGTRDPKNSTMDPQNNTSEPQNSINEPKNNTIDPKNTIKPKNSTIDPKNTMKPKNSTMDPQNSTSEPKNSTSETKNSTSELVAPNKKALKKHQSKLKIRNKIAHIMELIEKKRGPAKELEALSETLVKLRTFIQEKCLQSGSLVSESCSEAVEDNSSVCSHSLTATVTSVPCEQSRESLFPSQIDDSAYFQEELILPNITTAMHHVESVSPSISARARQRKVSGCTTEELADWDVTYLYATCRRP